jgi:prepilin-type N-terminal cleavage/methylation domain-containing protein
MAETFVTTKIPKKPNNKGFTLVEIMMIVAIMAILVAVMIPSFAGYRESVKRGLCDFKCSQAEEMYEVYLTMKDLNHTENLFAQFLVEYGEDICPDGSDVRYVDGTVQCLVHSIGGNEDSENDEGGGDDGGTVPFL